MAETREVYPASEGFIAVADRGSGEGLRMLLDNGLFFEFVPVEELDAPNPTRHWIGTIEPDRNYAIVLTTCAGLWSYILGDTVRFVDCATPRLLITGRTSYYLSAFGEHLIGEEIETSIETASGLLDLQIVDYAVGAIYPGHGGEKGYHLYVIEFTEPVDEQRLASFGELLDQTLQMTNLDYAEHRINDFQMSAPRIRIMPQGGFAAWMKKPRQAGSAEQGAARNQRCGAVSIAERLCQRVNDDHYTSLGPSVAMASATGWKAASPFPSAITTIQNSWGSARCA